MNAKSTNGIWEEKYEFSFVGWCGWEWTKWKLCCFSLFRINLREIATRVLKLWAVTPGGGHSMVNQVG